MPTYTQGFLGSRLGLAARTARSRAAAVLILLGAGCATDEQTSNQPWGGMKGWELNNGGVPSPWDTRGR